MAELFYLPLLSQGVQANVAVYRPECQGARVISLELRYWRYPLISLDGFRKEVVMSVLVFEQKVAAFEAVKENDRVWFPRWVRRYALAQRGGVDAGLPVNQHSVISFSRSLLDSGAPAWQR